MASSNPEEASLPALYHQVEYAGSPLEVLGVHTRATDAEVRDAYRALILRIHPDKAPNDSLRELHTSLFRKVHAAYEKLLTEDWSHAGHDEENMSTLKQLPETPEALHARNIAFKEALRHERERALNAKHLAEAAFKAVEDKQAEKRAFRVAKLEQKTREAQERQAARDEDEARRKALREERRKNAPSYTTTVEKGPDDPIVESWEHAQAYLEMREAKERKQQALGFDPTHKPKPLRNKPTAERNDATAEKEGLVWSKELDKRLVPEADIEHRWDKSLLSGGRSGSVSLALKKQREVNAAAKVQKMNMALCEEIDRRCKPWLRHRTLESLDEEEELMFKAFVGAEAEVDAKTDRMLDAMDKDVIDQHYVEYESAENPARTRRA